MDNMCHISLSLVGRKIVLQYGDSVRSFPKDSIFAFKIKSVWKGKNKFL